MTDVLISSILAENLSALGERHPVLLERLSHAGSADDCRVVSGECCLELTTADDARVRSNSSLQPQQEADGIVDRLGLEHSRCVVVLGLGLGYILEAVLKRLDDSAVVWVVEKRVEFMRAALELRDITAALKDRRIHWLVGLEVGEIRAKLEPGGLFMTQASVRVALHPPSHRVAPDYYDGAAEAVMETVRMGATNIATRVAAKNDFSANWVENLPALLSSPGVIRLFRVFTGKPAIIVSAGPSLSGALSDLAKAKGRTVLIAVDTAVRVLLEAGIRPDVMVAIDFTEVNFKHYDGVDFQEVPVVVVPTVYPRCLQVHTGPYFMINERGELGRLFAPYVGDSGFIRVGDSTSHTAFLLAEAMGCSSAVLVGQDLAYSGGVTHAEGIATQKNAPSPGKESLRNPFVDCNTGGRVCSSLSLVTILRHLEEIIESSPMQVVNASIGGAKIRGTQTQPLSQWLQAHPVEIFDAEAVIRTLSHSVRPVRAVALLREMRLLQRRLVRVERIARAAIRWSRKTLDRYCTEPRDIAGLGLALEEMHRFMNELREDWRLLTLLQPGLDGACIKMGWVRPGDGQNAEGDFIRGLMDERRFIEDLRVIATDLRAALRRQEEAVNTSVEAGLKSASASQLLEETVARYSDATGKLV